MAILATDGIRRRPVVVTRSDGTESIAIHSVGVLGMCWDHRAVDGAYVSSFLRRMAELMASPRLGVGALRRLGAAGPSARPGPLRRGVSRSSGRWPSARFDDYLLILEHPHVYTLGVRADPAHVLAEPGEVGAEPGHASTGAGTSPTTARASWSSTRCSPCPTARGPGRPTSAGSSRWSSTLWPTCGVTGVGRLDGYPGLWVEPDGPRPRKVAAVGVRSARAPAAGAARSTGWR